MVVKSVNSQTVQSHPLYPPNRAVSCLYAFTAVITTFTCGVFLTCSEHLNIFEILLGSSPQGPLGEYLTCLDCFIRAPFVYTILVLAILSWTLTIRTILHAITIAETLRSDLFTTHSQMQQLAQNLSSTEDALANTEKLLTTAQNDLSRAAVEKDRVKVNMEIDARAYRLQHEASLAAVERAYESSLRRIGDLERANAQLEHSNEQLGRVNAELEESHRALQVELREVPALQREWLHEREQLALELQHAKEESTHFAQEKVRVEGELERMKQEMDRVIRNKARGKRSRTIIGKEYVIGSYSEGLDEVVMTEAHQNNESIHFDDAFGDEDDEFDDCDDSAVVERIDTAQLVEIGKYKAESLALKAAADDASERAANSEQQLSETQAELAAREEELLCVQTDLAQHKQALLEANALLSERQQELLDVTAILTEREEALATATSLADAQIKSLRAAEEATETNTRLAAELSERLAAKDEEMLRLARALEITQQDVEAMKGIAAEREGQVRVVTAELENMQRAVDSALTLSTERQVAVEALQTLCSELRAARDAAQLQLETTAGERDTIKRELHAVAMERDAAQRELELSRGDGNDLASKCAAAEHELAVFRAAETQLREAALKHAEEAEKLRVALSAAQEESAKTHTEMDVLLEQLRDLNSEADTARVTVAELQSQLATLEEDNRDLHEQLRQTQDAAESLRAQCARREAEHAELHKILEERESSEFAATERLCVERAAAAATQEQLQTSLEAAEARLQAMEAEKSSLSPALEAMEAEKLSLCAALDAAEADKRSLSTSLETLDREKRLIEEKLADTERQRQRVVEELHRTQEALHMNQNATQQRETEYQEALTALQRRHEEYDMLQAELAQSVGESQALHANLAQQNEEVQRLREALTEAQLGLARREEELAVMQVSLDSANEATLLLRESFAAKNDIIGRMMEEANALTAELDASKHLVVVIEEEHKTLVVEHDILREERNNLSEECSSLAMQRDGLKDERDRLQEAAAAAQEQLTALTEATAIATIERETLQRSITEVAAERDGLRQALEAAEGDISTLRQRETRLLAGDEEAKKVFSELSSDRDRLMAENKSLVMEEERLVMEREDLKRRVDHLIAENVKIDGECRQLRVALDKLASEAESVQTSLKQRVETLTGELTKKDAALATALHLADSLQSETTVLAKKLEDTNAEREYEVRSLSERSVALQGEVAALTAELVEARRAMAAAEAARAAAEAARREEAAEHALSRAAKDRALVEAEVKLENIVQEKNVACEEAGVLRDRVKVLESNMTELSAKLDAVKCALEEKTTALSISSARVAELDGEVSRLWSVVTNQDKSLKVNEEKVAMKEKVIVDLRASVAEKQRQITQVCADRDRIAQDLRRAQEMIRGNETPDFFPRSPARMIASMSTPAHKKVLQTINEAETQREAAEREADALRQSISVLERERAELQQLHQTTREELVAERVRREEGERALLFLKEDLQEVRNDYQTLRNAVKHREDSVQQRDQDTTTQIAQLQARVAMLEQEKSKLRAEALSAYRDAEASNVRAREVLEHRYGTPHHPSIRTTPLLTSWSTPQLRSAAIDPNVPRTGTHGTDKLLAARTTDTRDGSTHVTTPFTGMPPRKMVTPMPTQPIFSVPENTPAGSEFAPEKHLF